MEQRPGSSDIPRRQIVLWREPTVPTCDKPDRADNRRRPRRAVARSRAEKPPPPRHTFPSRRRLFREERKRRNPWAKLFPPEPVPPARPDNRPPLPPAWIALS